MFTYNGNIVTYGGNWVRPDPVNPLYLPPYTIRCKFSSGYMPTMGDSQTLVDASANIWDIYKSGTDWNSLFNGNTQLEEVIAANTTGVTNMATMFNGCWSLTSVPLFDTSLVTDMSNMFRLCTYLASVPLFDTSSVTNMAAMFTGCTYLTSVPLFDTGSVTNMYDMFSLCANLASMPLFDTSSVSNMNYMFNNCYAVESGALALYRQASTQANPPTNHTKTFTNCGRDTVTGAAELAQIPTSWGGTMA